MYYLKVMFDIAPIEPYRDMLLFELNELEFETHEETPGGLVSYISADKVNMSAVEEIIKEIPARISFTTEKVKQENWNEVWESAFEPVVVNDTCIIHAPFHQVEKKKYNVLLSPKMAFGTGHHATTYLMSKALFEEDLKERSVLDMGCGTSVLAVLAEKLGADAVDAVDIDEWAYQNSIENITLNGCTKIRVEQGGAELLQKRLYDCILANINKNVLLKDMPVYAGSLKAKGNILFSGFYKEDESDIIRRAEEFGLTFVRHESCDRWLMLKMRKKE